MGEIKVPADALWGASTQRAIENFPISSRRLPLRFIIALATIKKFAAEANGDLGALDKRLAGAISSAAEEIVRGRHREQFPLDTFQTGSATSTNMNANEVIANIANLGLGGTLGTWSPVHPNDHVNMGQSSNDVIPSSIHVAAAVAIKEKLLPSLGALRSALGKKADEFDGVLKIGRTHLMDAMPIRLGQEFGGWARQIEKGMEAIGRAVASLLELALGGTAVGTGFGAHPKLAARICKGLSKELGLDFRPAKNFFEALASRAPCAEVSGSLKACAISLVRIAEDIKLLSSGPRLGLGEMRLPAVQPGSSIMPGKVNPVIPEMVCQVGIQVIANDAAITHAAVAGHLELNTKLPTIASNLIESIEILANASHTFANRCVAGIEANEEKCQSNIARSLALAMALVPRVGYAMAAEIAAEAARTGKTIREVSSEQKIASEEEIDKLLDPDRLAGQ